MQSPNGLTGQGINLNDAVGVNGGSPVDGVKENWNTGHNTDVLKITDIGVVQTTTGTQTPPSTSTSRSLTVTATQRQRSS